MPLLMPLARVRWLLLTTTLSREPPDADLISVLLAYLDDVHERN